MVGFSRYRLYGSSALLVKIRSIIKKIVEPGENLGKWEDANELITLFFIVGGMNTAFIRRFRTEGSESMLDWILDYAGEFTYDPVDLSSLAALEKKLKELFGVKVSSQSLGEMKYLVEQLPLAERFQHEEV